jgi:hypothetical protein
MRFLSWLRLGNRFQGHARGRGCGAARQRATFRPRVEALEGRDVPSTLTVTNNLGFGAGLLRAEIAAAHPGDTIDFAVSGRIDLSSNAPFFGGGSYELVIDKSLDIEGPGAANLAINGGYIARVFRVIAGVQVTISGLTIEYGNGTTGAYDPVSDDLEGGEILNYGTLTLTGCQVSGDGVNSNAYYVGGIYNAGTLTVLNSTVIGNSAYEGADVFTDHLFTKQNSTIGKITKY